MKHILVLGDRIYDHNLIEKQITAPVKQAVFSPIIHCWSQGGVFYLKKLIESFYPLGQPEISITDYPHAKPDETSQEKTPIPESYQIWSLQERTKGSTEKKVWRIRLPLGITKSVDESQTLEVMGGNPGKADLMIIDDLGLGFCDHIKDPSLFFTQANAADIILKTSNLRYVSSLWNWLFQTEDGRSYLDRLTVVLSANTLRKRGASISKGLSWDMTIEDVVREMKGGISSLDLALCKRVVIQFDYEGIASFRRVGQGYPPEMDFFLYHPAENEGMFSEKRPGLTFGALSIITASIACHTISPDSHPLFLALCRGIEAARMNHEEGGGSDSSKFNIESTIGKATETILKREPGETIFRTFFPRFILSDSEPIAMKQERSNLLRDVTGEGDEYVAIKAFEIVMRGVESALSDIPTATYGKYITADREEIERINALKSLILTYEAKPDERQPLSIAVFGSPGSGKSFAIKQLADELFGKNKAILEFNLSQLNNTEDLHVAFHKVRDASIMNTIPLVFWDEFDTRKLEWLKEFLAPMQDAQFVSKGVIHPFGKAVFIFAGGTRESFEAFRCSDENEEGINPKLVKKTDFISRLKGYVNIKGPNPAGSTKEDPSYIIRRAIILRKAVEKSYKNLIGVNNLVSIESAIINAFLRVNKYEFGARSLESILTMSNLAHTRHFDVSLLPPKSVLDIHVGDDFLKYVQQGQLDYGTIEVVANAIHEAWRRVRDKKKDDDRDIEYALLKESDKENNRRPARLTKAKLHAVGLDLIRRDKVLNPSLIVEKQDAKDQIEALMEIEHDIWLRELLIKGFRARKQGEGKVELETNKSHFIHVDVVPFKDVIKEHQGYDRAITEALWDDEVKKRNYVVVKLKNSDKGAA